MNKRILEMQGVSMTGRDGEATTTMYIEVIEGLELGERMAEVEDLPTGWRRLRWYRMCQSPCLWGDDILLAVDNKNGAAYSCFDECCTRHYYGGPVSIKAHALAQCAVSCSVFSIEETMS